MRVVLERLDGESGELALGWRHADTEADALREKLARERPDDPRLAGNAAAAAWSRHFYRLAAGPWNEDAAVAQRELEDALRAANPMQALSIAPAWCRPVANVLRSPLIGEIERLRVLAIDWLELGIVVSALASRPRASLQVLELGVASYGEIMARGEMYTVAFERGPAVASDVARRLADTTPRLRQLTVVGSRVLGGLVHPSIERLVLRGDPIDGCPFEPDASEAVEPELALPSLARLEQTVERDEYRPFPTRPIALEPREVPALRELLWRGDFGYETHTPFGILGEAAILSQLRSVTFPELYEPMDRPRLDELAPRFRHLDRFAVAKLLADQTDEAARALEVRFQAALPNLSLG